MSKQSTKPNTPATSPNAANVVAKQPTLRLIGADETFSPSTRMLEPGRWETRYAVKADEKSTDRYEVVTVYDFRSTSPTEVQELALKHCRIDTQRKFRDAAKLNRIEALKAANWAAVDVKSGIVDAARKSADPAAKVMSAVLKNAASMNAEQRAALIALLSEPVSPAVPNDKK